MKYMAQSGFGFWKIGVTIILTILFLAVATAIASAATIYVPDDYPAIQAAVDNATAGDTIIVRDGTYTENVYVNKPHLTIRSENGAETTIVHAANPDYDVFGVSADYVNISGFTVEGATGETRAGIILNVNDDYCTISNNNIVSNEVGIFLHYSSHNTVINNNINSNQHGIRLYKSGGNMITNNNINSNHRGIYMILSYDNTITENTFKENAEYGLYMLCYKDYDLVVRCNGRNKIYHNNFVDNFLKPQMYASDSLDQNLRNYLDDGYPSGGNYWSDYAGDDLYGGSSQDQPGSDGIGDTPYISHDFYGGYLHDGYCLNPCQDGYPLMNPWTPSGPDTTPPTVSSVSPQNGATDVTSDTVVTATFSEAMAGSTITKDSFTLAGSAVSGTVTYDSDTYTATFTPDANLEYNHEYTTTLSTAITDKAGNPLTEAYTWSFTTEPAPAQKTIYVDDDFIDDPELHKWNTIQEGVDDANDGDTIIVYPGTYTENVEVGKSVTIESENGADSTIVQAANPEDHVFEVTADEVTISGFTVKGATEDPNAGIYLGGADNCIISDNKVSNNNCGIHLYDSNGNELTGNTANSNKRGIILANLSSYNILTSNTANSNDLFGIVLWPSDDNTLTSNTANLNSWGIFLIGSSGNTLSDNTANNNEVGIGLVSASNNELKGNTASNNAEGISLQDSSSNNELIGNTASNNYYGIHLDSTNNKIYINNFISNTNNVHSDGSNIWNSPEKLTYTYNGNTYTNYLGNYWDDYTGSDANNDGIGDTPYPINSDNDNFPLREQFENYEIGEDTTPPTVTTVSPEDGASGVVIDTVVTATFSEAMDSSTITTDSFTLAGSAVSGTVTYDSDTYTATFTPDPNLEYNHEYTATLSTAITDKAGNPLAEAKIWSFTTQSGPVTAKILPVPYYSQDGTEWCVPTSMSMISKYYGKPIHPWDIAEDWGWERKISDWQSSWYTTKRNIVDFFDNEGLSTKDIKKDDFEAIKDSIDEGTPIFIKVTGLDHAVVVVGYKVTEGSDIVYINDPSDALDAKGLVIGERERIAAEVDWNELTKYWGYLSYAIAIDGNPSYPKGTIDINDEEGGFYFHYEGDETKPMCGVYSWRCGKDGGIIWDSEPSLHPLEAVPQLVLAPKTFLLF